MGLASALSTALTGLSAAETTIDVVGNNLANSNTVGFKASEAAFATQFLQTRSLGSGPTVNSGGTNPRQIGLGTMVADITPNFNQGTVEISSNPTDMAIQGDGFFIVDGRNGGRAYTRNGIFKMNAESQLTTITGNRVLGYGVNDQFEIQTTTLQPITIPLGSAAVAKATENVYMEGTLSPTGALADAAKIIQTGVLGDASFTHPTTAPSMSISGAPDMSLLGITAVDGATLIPPVVGNVPTGNYYYKIVFSDGAPGGALNLDGAPSAASVVVPINNATPTNAARFTNLLNLTPPDAHYTNINFYRTDGVSGQGGTYTYVGQANVGDTEYVDTSLAGTTALNENVLTGQYNYYVAFGKSGSEPSRPSDKIGPLRPADGRIHIWDLPSAGANPNGWDSWVVYRNAPSTGAGDNRYFEVSRISFTSATPYFTDNTLDTSLYTSELVHNTEIDLDGPVIQKSTLLSNVRQRTGSSYEQLFADTGTMRFTGLKGGRTLATKEMTVSATSTVGDLLTFMEEAMGIQKSDASTGIPRSLDLVHNTVPTYISPGADVVDGKIQITGNNGLDNAVDIKTSGIQMVVGQDLNSINMPFYKYQDAVGESAVADFMAYDSLGIACQARITAVLESRDSTATTYRWFADSPDNQLASGAPNIAVGTGLIRFDGEGNFISSTQSTVSINRENIASKSPLSFQLDFNNLSGLAATVSTLAVSRQDGSAPGVLNSFIVGEDGRISGVFSNGVTRDLGQIRLVRFGNPAGLEQLGENMYTAGVNSGMPVEGNPSEQGIGSIVSGAVELSNADIGGNLIDLILASTMYRGNTRVITTVQQMFDELLQLRR